MLKTKLADRENVCPVDVAKKIIAIVGNMYDCFFRKFALSFLPNFVKSVICYFVLLEPKILRRLKKGLLVTVVNTLDLLLKRYKSLGEKYEILEKFQLKIAKLLLSSNFLDK